MSYPVNLELDAPPEVANWRPLVHWILVLPHMLIVGVLANVASVLALVSWFIILFTGKLPEGIANVQCLILRYEVRAYSYAMWLREPYPPFEFDMTPADPGTDPVRVHLSVDLEDRNRLTVGLRFIWILPAALFLLVIAFAAWLAMVVAFFVVLFTGRWPESLRSFVIGSGRVWLRVAAYGYLLVDEYPPFELD